MRRHCVSIEVLSKCDKTRWLGQSPSKSSQCIQCEAAGRGFTTGKTAQDDEVQVLNPDEDRVCGAVKLQVFQEATSNTGFTMIHLMLSQEPIQADRFVPKHPKLPLSLSSSCAFSAGKRKDAKIRKINWLLKVCQLRRRPWFSTRDTGRVEDAQLGYLS